MLTCNPAQLGWTQAVAGPTYLPKCVGCGAGAGESYAKSVQGVLSNSYVPDEIPAFFKKGKT